MLDGHDESRSAIAALRSAPVAVSFLNGGEAPVFAYALDRRNLLTLATGGQKGACHHRYTVNEYSACAAGRVVTSTLGSGQIEVLAQHIEQELARLESELARAAVDAKFYEFFFQFRFSFRLLPSS